MQKAGGKEKMHNRKKSINSGDNKFPRTFILINGGILLYYVKIVKYFVYF